MFKFVSSFSTVIYCIVTDSLVVDSGGHGHGDQEDQKHEQRKYHTVIFPARQADALRGRFRCRLFQRHVVTALVHLRNKRTDPFYILSSENGFIFDVTIVIKKSYLKQSTLKISA